MDVTGIVLLLVIALVELCARITDGIRRDGADPPGSGAGLDAEYERLCAEETGRGGEQW